MLPVCVISLIVHMLYGMYVYRLYKHTDTCQTNKLFMANVLDEILGASGIATEL